MFLDSKFLSAKHINVFVLCGFLAACNNDTDEKINFQDSVQSKSENKTGTIEPKSTPEPGKQISVKGGAIKGVIENGIVRVFSVDGEAGLYRKASTPLGDAERTDKNGQFDVSIPANSLDTIVVEITADIHTRMTCDVVDGCGLNAKGALIPFGKKFPLNDDFILEAAYFGLQDKDQLTLYVTPLTHLAVSHAVAQADGLSADNISAAYSLVEETLKLSPGSLQLPPPDLTRLDAYDTLSGDALQYAVMSASFLAMVNMPDWTTIDEVVNSAANRFALSGGLPDENGGVVSEVTLDDLFYQASDIASDLQSETTNNQIIVELVSVESSTDMYYQEVSSLYVDEPVSKSSGTSLGDVAAAPVVETPVEIPDSGTEVSTDNSSGTSSGSDVVAPPIVNAPIVDAPVVDLPVAVAPEVEAPTETDGPIVPVVTAPIQPLVITAQPGSTTTMLDSSVQFSVVAQGEGALYYQWRKNDINIKGETGATLSIGQAQLSDAGVYNVLVMNSTGTISSFGATLLVESAPVLTAELKWSIPEKRQDGSDLLNEDVAGYVLSYGTQSDALTSEVVINDANETTYIFEDLNAKKTYYFKIATVDINGIQGEFSEIVTKSFM